MVNVDDPKSIILSSLRRAKTPVGGETLAEAAGISRVAVWKQIQNLRDLGYGIESAHQGYLLSQDADTPASWEIHPQGRWNLFFAPTTDSTMELSSRLKDKDLPAVTIAGEQSVAINRDGHKWNSPQGGLYATLRLVPEGGILDTPQLCACASLAAARSLQEILRKETDVRWPNEILIADKKVGGVLVEASGTLGHLDYLAVGIGLWPGDFHRAKAAQNLLDGFDSFWEHKEQSFNIWRESCAKTAMRQKKNLSIRINGSNREYDDASVDDTGRMILKNKTQTIVCGFSDKIDFL